MTNRFLFGLMLLWLSSPLQAEQYAFLVGVRDYSLNNELTSLKYTEDDVHTLASTLLKSGVPQENVIVMTQRMAASKARLSPRSDQIRKELALLLSELTVNDSIVVGFSGHGLQFKDDPVNYFCPLDAKPDDKSTLISLSEVYESLNQCKAQTKLMLVDACRDDPLSVGAKSAKRIELQQVSDRLPPVLAGGTIAIFSCSASQQSFESTELKGSLFFHFVNRALAGEADEDGDKSVDLIELEFFTIKSVQKWARVNLGKPQIPERMGRAVGAMELVRLDRSPKQEPPMNTLPSAGAAPKSITNSIGMKLNLIPAGTFMMGSPTSEAGRRENEVQHRVTLTKDFYIGTTEVTQGQWESVMGTTPWKGKQNDQEGINIAATPNQRDISRRPIGVPGKGPEGINIAATYISWIDAFTFCQKLSAKEGKTYRLPTESEWEYACRGGSTTAFCFGDDVAQLGEYAWWGASFNGSAAAEPYIHAVGLKRANAFGLYDMHGNAVEWCNDWQGDYPREAVTDPQGTTLNTYRVNRGGIFARDAHECRSACRFTFTFGYDFSGFRVVLD